MESGLGSSQGTRDRKKETGPRYARRKFRLDIGKDFSMGKAVIEMLLINICSKKKGVEEKIVTSCWLLVCIY